MRRSPKTEILRDDDGLFIAFMLAADFVSEHEWGVGKLKAALNIPDFLPHTRVNRPLPNLQIGLAGRTATHAPGSDAVRLFQQVPFSIKGCGKRGKPTKGEAAALFLNAYSFDNDAALARQMEEYKPYEAGDLPALRSAWSDRDVGIFSFGDTAASAALVELHEAIMWADVAIWFSGTTNPFARSGLMVGIASRVPAEGAAMMEAADQKLIELHQVGAATGIAERLEKAGRSYFALSPRLLDREGQKERQTEYPVIFWLNPMEQKENRSGYFTVEELDAWAKGKGPILNPRP